MKVKPAAFRGTDCRPQQCALNTYKVSPHGALFPDATQGPLDRHRKGVIYMPGALFPLSTTINHCGAAPGRVLRRVCNIPCVASAIRRSSFPPPRLQYACWWCFVWTRCLPVFLVSENLFTPELSSHFWNSSISSKFVEPMGQRETTREIWNVRAGCVGFFALPGLKWQLYVMACFEGAKTGFISQRD